MRLFYLFIVGVFLFVSCNDPSLDMAGDDDGVVEPMPEVVSLNTIQVAETTMNNITEDIAIIYDSNGLITQVSFTYNSVIIYDFEYADNNRLETVTKNDGNILQYNFTYDADAVFLDYTDASGDQIEKELSTDTQNRIDRVVTKVTDMSGNSNQTEDLRYQYTANFNVSRINSIATNGTTIDAYSEFTYEFNNNPFRDMNDVLRLLIFPEFIPYTRYLPSSRIDYTATTSGFDIDRSFTYLYTLQDDEFPSSREITKTEAGSTTVSFEFFNYL